MKFKGSINGSKVTADVGIVSDGYIYAASIGIIFEGNGDGVLMHLKPPQPSMDRAWEHASRCMKILGFEEENEDS